MLNRLFAGIGRSHGNGAYKHGDKIMSRDKTFEHSPNKEMDFIVSCDKISPECGDECFIISSRWIKKWMEYGKGQADLSSVGPIDNNHLVEMNGNKLVIRVNIVPKVDYRCVSKVMW